MEMFVSDEWRSVLQGKIFCPFVLGFPQLLAAVAHSSSCLSTAVALASRLLVLPRGGDAV